MTHKNVNLYMLKYGLCVDPLTVHEEKRLEKHLEVCNKCNEEIKFVELMKSVIPKNYFLKSYIQSSKRN